MALKAKSKVTADKRKNLGVRPMEMLLGLGDCSAFDVALILRKGRQQVTDCIADIEAERADTDSKVFNRLLKYFPSGARLQALRS